MFRSKSLRAWIAGLCTTLLMYGGATAQSDPARAYPKQSIRLLVGFPAGGTTDVLARMVAEGLSTSLKQPVVVENHPGASGLIATGNVAKARPDGYTLLFASSTHAIYPKLYRNVSFDPIDSFTPIGLVATTPYVMVVHPSLPVRTVAEFIELAKDEPGQINYAGSSPGTAQHLGWELFKRMSVTDMQYIPYKGSSDALSDLRSGRVQAAIDNVAVMRQQIEGGHVRALAVTSRQPSNVLSGVPTIADSGVADFEAVGWFGVFAPQSISRDVADALSQSLQAIMQQGQLREKLVMLGAESQSGSPQDLQRLLSSEVRKWGDIIESANIGAQ